MFADPNETVKTKLSTKDYPIQPPFARTRLNYYDDYPNGENEHPLGHRADRTRRPYTSPCPGSIPEILDEFRSEALSNRECEASTLPTPNNAIPELLHKLPRSYPGYIYRQTHTPPPPKNENIEEASPPYLPTRRTPQPYGPSSPDGRTVLDDSSSKHWRYETHEAEAARAPSPVRSYTSSSSKGSSSSWQSFQNPRTWRSFGSSTLSAYIDGAKRKAEEKDKKDKKKESTAKRHFIRSRNGSNGVDVGFQGVTSPAPGEVKDGAEEMSREALKGTSGVKKRRDGKLVQTRKKYRD